MFADALRVAGEFGGTLVGNCAIAHIVPGLSFKVWTIEAPRDRIDHVKLMCDGKIRVGPYTSSGMSPLVIEQCYYEPSGVFRASPDALAAAASRTMRPVAPVRLDRVYTFRRHGFKITGVTLSDHCLYMPELHEQLMDTSEITVIEFEDMHVTAEILEDLSRPDRTYVFRRCMVSVRSVAFDYAEDTVFFGTDISHKGALLTRCSGCVTVYDYMFNRMIDCPDLCVESIISPDTAPFNNQHNYGNAFVVEYVSGLVEVYGLICRYEDAGRNTLRMKLFAAMTELSWRQLDSIDFDTCSTMPEHWQLCAKNQRYLTHFMDHVGPFSVGAIRALESAPVGVRVPVDAITSLGWLVQFTKYGMTYVRYPYYTNFLSMTYDQLNSATKRVTIDPRILASDIPSFMVTLKSRRREKFGDAVFRPAHIVKLDYDHSDDVCLVMDINIDAIMDMIDREGITPDIMYFLQRQIQIDWMHDNALTRALRGRTDMSDDIIRTIVPPWLWEL